MSACHFRSEDFVDGRAGALVRLDATDLTGFFFFYSCSASPGPIELGIALKDCTKVPKMPKDCSARARATFGLSVQPMAATTTPARKVPATAKAGGIRRQQGHAQAESPLRTLHGSDRRTRRRWHVGSEGGTDLVPAFSVVCGPTFSVVSGANGARRRGATKAHRSQSSLPHSQDPIFTAGLALAVVPSGARAVVPFPWIKRQCSQPPKRAAS